MNRHLRTLVVAFLSTLIAVAAVAQESKGTRTKEWYRGNLHTHSLWSDGNDFPEMICDWYKRSGYQFLALSDHNILSDGEKWIDEAAATKRGSIGGVKRYIERFGRDWVETRTKDDVEQIRLKTLKEFRPKFDEPGKFIMIQSEEITDHFGALPIHLNATNIKEVIKPQGGQTLRETIANNLIAVRAQSRRVGQPILAHLNHPNFGFAVTAEDMAAVLEEEFFEVYNGHPSVHHLGDKSHVGMERMWDIANTLRISEMKARPLYGIATDDSHNYFGERGASPGRGWVMVHAAALDPKSLIDAITAGEFYASSGVRLDRIQFDADKQALTVDIVPVDGETYVTEFVGTVEGFDKSSEPVVDDEGKPIAATRKYSSDVGKVLAKVEGLHPSYKLSGKELYVRAVVTSSAKPENPAFDEQHKQAWTQPVGWEKKIASK